MPIVGEHLLFSLAARVGARVIRFGGSATLAYLDPAMRSPLRDSCGAFPRAGERWFYADGSSLELFLRTATIVRHIGAPRLLVSAKVSG